MINREELFFMAFVTNQNTASQFVGILHSEQIFNTLISLSEAKNYIGLSKKQKAQLKFFEKYNFNILKPKSSFNVLSNSAKNRVKAQLFSVGLSHSPLKQSNEASRNTMEMMYTYDILTYLAQKNFALEDDQVHTSMLTISFENADKEHLSDSIQELLLFYRQLKDFFRKTLDWKDNDYLGTIPSLEVTINSAKLEKHNPKAIWHAHLHILIFTSCELEIKSVRSKIWNKYSSLCKKAGIYASEKAFLLENAYAKAEGQNSYDCFLNDKKKKKQQEYKIARAATAEAGKYAIKSSDYNKFLKFNEKNEPDDFALQCFAELYSSFVKPSISKNCEYKNANQLRKRLTKRVRMQGSGLYQTARQIFNALKDVGLDGIFLFKKANGDMSRVPNFFTQALQIGFNNLVKNKDSESGYRYYASILSESSLNLAEIIYYNSDFLANTLFPAKKVLNYLIAKHRPVEMSKKQEAIFDVLLNFSAYRTSKEQIIDVFNDWIKTVKENVYVEKDGTSTFDKNKVHDLQQVRNAYDEAENNDIDFYKNVRIFKNLEVAKNFKKIMNGDGFEQFITNDSPFVFKDNKYKDYFVNSAEKDGKFSKSVHDTSITMKDIQIFRKYQKNLGDNFCVTVETIKLVPVIFAYLRLKGLEIRLSKSDYDGGAQIWEYWTNRQAGEQCACSAELGFIVDCLEFALNPTLKLKEKILYYHNTEIMIDLVVDADHLEKMIVNLYKKNASKNNPAFKNIDIDKTVTYTKPNDIERLINMVA